jgi:hypothetical protein
MFIGHPSLRALVFVMADQVGRLHPTTCEGIVGVPHGVLSSRFFIIQMWEHVAALA